MPNSEVKQLAIIDDDPHVLAALTRLFKKEGYQIQAFTRPVDALSFLAEQPVGVIITDQCMPQMEGSELLERVNELQPDAIPILLSGYVDLPSDRASCLTLSKPWDDETLRLAVAGAFERHQAQHVR